MIRFCSFCMAAFPFFFLFKFELLCFNSCKAFKWFVLNRNVVNSLLSNIANFLDFYCSFHQLKQYKGKTNKKAFLLFSNGQKFKIWSSEEEKKVFLFEYFFYCAKLVISQIYAHFHLSQWRGWKFWWGFHFLSF